MKKPLRPVLFIFAIAALALGVTVYFGVQADQPTLVAKRVSIAAPVNKAPVTVWAVGSIQASDILLEAVESWQAELGQKVNVRIFPNRLDYETARIVASQHHQMPDVFWVSGEEIEYLDQISVLQRIPLDGVKAEQWLPQTFAPFVRGNSLLAFPAQYEVTVLYYNRRHFDEVGVAYPGPLWNWESLTTIGRALYKTPQGGQPARYGLEFVPTLDLWNAFAAQTGQPLYQGRSWLLDPAAARGGQRDALQFLIDLQQTYTFGAPAQAEDKPLFFEQNRSAMLIAGSSRRAAFARLPDLAWGVAPLPDYYALDSAKAKRIAPLRISGWAISAKTPQFASAYVVAEKLSALCLDGGLSARSDAATPSEEEGGGLYAQVLATATPPLMHVHSPRINEILNNLLATMKAASTTPDKFFPKVRVGLQGFKLETPPDDSATVPAPAPAPDPASTPAP